MKIIMILLQQGLPIMYPKLHVLTAKYLLTITSNIITPMHNQANPFRNHPKHKNTIYVEGFIEWIVTLCMHMYN